MAQPDLIILPTRDLVGAFEAQCAKIHGWEVETGYFVEEIFNHIDHQVIAPLNLETQRQSILNEAMSVQDEMAMHCVSTAVHRLGMELYAVLKEKRLYSPMLLLEYRFAGLLHNDVLLEHQSLPPL